jgi:hypothetical protein
VRWRDNGRVAKVYDEITPKLRAWIEAQHLFFVATAPLAADGHLNVSPRGGKGMSGVIDSHTFAWLDLIGSGAETIAHLRENGRIVVMLCAFDGPPQIVRMHGRGRVVTPADDEWDRLAARFVTKRNARAIVVVDVSRISDSCGFGVPRLDYVAERDLLDQWADRRTDEQIEDYRTTRNAESIDGLPALAPDHGAPVS